MPGGLPKLLSPDTRANLVLEFCEAGNIDGLSEAFPWTNLGRDFFFRFFMVSTSS